MRLGTLALGLVVLTACSASPPPRESPPPSPVLTVNAVLDRIAAAKLPASNAVIWTPDTDPVHLLGRPGQYTASASFEIPGGDPTAPPGRIGRGGVVEVWPDATSAANRVRLIQSALSGAGGMLGTEYDYQAGGTLLRITGTLTPDVAARYGRTLTS
jgi:hypothetical protein